MKKQQEIEKEFELFLEMCNDNEFSVEETLIIYGMFSLLKDGMTLDRYHKIKKETGI